MVAGSAAEWAAVLVLSFYSNRSRMLVAAEFSLCRQGTYSNVYFLLYYMEGF